MPAPPPIDSHWDYDDPVGSERAFEELDASLSQDAPPAYRAELLTQLARARALQRRFDDADRTLDEAEAVPGGGTDRVLVRVALERGRIRNDLGETERALALFVEARERGRAAGEDALVLDAEHMLGYVTPPEEAIRWNRQAIETARGSSDPSLRRWLGTLHMNLGRKLLDLGRFEEGRGAYASAETHRREAGQERAARDARAFVGRALRLDGRPEDALALVRELLEEPGVDPEWNGYLLEEAAESLLALGRPGEAREHFARAHPILAQDPWFPPRERDRLERIRRLGEGG